MVPNKLIEYQYFSFTSHVGALAQRCIRRFRDAAVLVGVDLSQWPMIENWASHRITFYDMRSFWDVICEKYNKEIYDPQLILSFPTSEIAIFPYERVGEEDLFSQFVYWKLWPIIVSDNDCVRNLIRVIEYIPSKNPARAAECLVNYVEEMNFCIKMKPDTHDYFE